MTDRVREALAEVAAVATALLERTTDYERQLATIAYSCARALHATCVVTLFDDNGRMTPVAAHDDDPDRRAICVAMVGRAQPLDCAFERRLAEAKILHIPALDREARPPTLFKELHGSTSPTGLIAVLLRVHDETLGALVVLRHDRERPPLDELDRDLAVHLASIAGMAIANARLFRRAKSADALRESGLRAIEARMFLDAIIENIPHVVFVKDAVELSYVRVNRATETLLNFKRGEIIGKNDFDFLPPTVAEFCVAKDREALNSGQVIDIPEERILTMTGECWRHTKKVPIFGSDGEPRYLLGISEDITDKRRDLAALATARNAADSASRELEAFSHAVAHDLRTPLRALDRVGRTLIEGDELGRGHCAQIQSAAQRISTLVDDLIQLSRLDGLELRRQAVDLGELFHAALAPLQRREPSRGTEIVVDGELDAIGDPKLLAVVFDNLCGIAWRLTSTRDRPRIELGSRRADEERLFFIRDNGVGFATEHAQKLFHRIDPESELPVTGIGLAMVQRIIARHGGRTWAESEVGAGATYFFTLGA